MVTLLNSGKVGGVFVAGLAAYLQGEIERRSWSAAQLAAKAGIDKSALNYIFDHPESVPRLKTLDGLADALDVPLSRLIRLCGYEPGDNDSHLDAEQMAILREASAEYRAVVDMLPRFSPEDLRAIEAYLAGRMQTRSRHS